MGETMEIRTLQVRFVTPAFLGDAEQSGRWRTPPFKHLLREWWRVAWVGAGNDPADWQTMRAREALLFGHAWLQSDRDERGRPVHARRSQVRVRLQRWDEGGMKKWRATARVQHPEVGRNGAAVGSDLYLGYGPLEYDRNGKTTVLKRNAAIQANESAELRLAWPQAESSLLDSALVLVHGFGAIGGRSRNGWGSVELEGAGNPAILPLRDWQDSLRHEWAHAIGQDDTGPLIWRTETHADWTSLMKTLAEIKIGLRTHFPFRSGKNAPAPEYRHWLSYPVTNHSVRGWRNRRLPNSLRFKVRSEENGKVFGVIFHMPCRPHWATERELPTIERVWQEVHRYLDGRTNMERMPG